MERILVIEDDEMIAKMLRSVLEKAGYAVSEARNGKEGLLAQQREAADLVITDLIMPEKEGIETIIELRRTYPGLRIIAMSGGGRTGSAGDYLQIARQVGAARVVAKPFALEQMVATIREVLSQPKDRRASTAK